MEIADYLASIEAEGIQLLAAAELAGLDAPVPSCPDWTVRDLVTHIGGVHRWAADLVSHARTEFATAAGSTVGTGPADGELIEWAHDGRAQVVAALRAAPEDLTCFTLWPDDSALRFWARRQSHETAIHRADAAAAAGLEASYDESFASDGVAEMLHGFARRKKEYPPATIRLDDGSAPWQISMGEGGVTARAVDESSPGPDATVTGAASDLYLWLWNRPTSATVSGSAAAAANWEQIRVRWS